MLQQTQISTVLDGAYYTNWMDRFPNVETLAEAPEEAILKAWEGLGYYRRARNLQKAARAVVEQGAFPQTVEAIRALPGVGDYTAGAVASCAFGLATPVVDTNVARVLSRLMDSAEPVDSTVGKRQLWDWAAVLVDPKAPADFNSGLMELGQRVCRPKRPQCSACPVNQVCLTRDPESLPVKKARVSPEDIEEEVCYLRDGDRVFLTQEQDGRREGLWRLPHLGSGQSKGRNEVLRFKYGITKYRVTLRVYLGQMADAGHVGRCVEIGEALAELAMAAPYRKALTRLLKMETDSDVQLR